MNQQFDRRSSLWTQPYWMVAAIALAALILAGCTGQLPAAPAPAAPTDAPVEEAAATEVAAEEQADSGTVPAPEEATPVDLGELTIADEQFKGMTVGFTEAGFPFRGDPDAPVIVYEYSDFECPFCARYATQTEPAINDNFVRDGSLLVIFRDFPLEGLHPNAPAAHAAALCAADQGAVAYWEMHDEIFRAQSEWANSTDTAGFFGGLAEQLGLDMDAFNSCVASGEKTAMVDAGVAEATAHGFTGTPSFRFVSRATGERYDLIGAQPYEQFAGYIDAMIAGEAPVDPQAQAQAQAGEPQIPVWATAEGLAVDPDRPGYNMAGDQYRGNPDAEVVVIEFSDFQCPFCRRHTEDTQPILDEQFVDTGDVLWVYKHFPLNIHPQAPAAGVAAECAAEQGLFWEMHELLFANTEAWSQNDPNPGLLEVASQLDLDQDAFAACLEDETMAERVTSDMMDGAPFVQGTPTFVVLYGGQGTLIPGALPPEQFTEVLQQALDGSLGN